MTNTKHHPYLNPNKPIYVSTKQLAHIWGVKTATILRWTHTHPQFAQHAILLPSGEWRYHMEKIEHYFRSLAHS